MQKRIDRQRKRIAAVHPIIYHLLREAEDHTTARHYLQAYLHELQRMMARSSLRKQPLEWVVQEQGIDTFLNLISVRSERLTRFSLVRLLWKIANGRQDRLPKDLNDGFFEEIVHLLLAIQGESGIYDRESYPEFTRFHGRKASLLRSEQLERIGQKALGQMQQYPSGMENRVRKRREGNRRRILQVLKGGEKEWNDYSWHLRHVIRSAQALEKLVRLTPDEKSGIDAAARAGVPFGITPYYVSLMDRDTDRRNDHAVRAQVIPPGDMVRTLMRHRGDPGHSLDFMMEKDTSPVDLVTRRYPMIAILKPYNTCSQICVYCQRNWEITDVLAPNALASPSQIQTAVDWIRRHRAIREILVTGGDPLVMGDRRVVGILESLSRIGHIERIRIGSRIPVVLPMRITDSLADAIAQFHVPGRREIALVTHFIHPYEITPESMEAVQRFRRRGMSVYNQAVFTIENSRRFEQAALRRLLKLIGVDPYYTFNTKGKEETKRYRVPLVRLQQEIKEEARLLPGLLRTDEPVYNVPRLGKNYLRAQQHHRLLGILPSGKRVYEFHPWEKNLALADTYIDEDVSIHDYLQELKARGENPEDYKTIWYYY